MLGNIRQYPQKKSLSHFNFSNKCARAKELQNYLFVEVKLKVKIFGSFTAPGSA